MPREFRHLMMTKIRRIIRSPESECIAGLLLMQVILVCVAHAAQKTWYTNKMACGDPEMDVTVPGGFSTSFTPGTEDAGRILWQPRHRIRALWESIARFGEYFVTPLAGPVFPATPACAGDPGMISGLVTNGY